MEAGRTHAWGALGAAALTDTDPVNCPVHTMDTAGLSRSEIRQLEQVRVEACRGALRASAGLRSRIRNRDTGEDELAASIRLHGGVTPVFPHPRQRRPRCVPCPALPSVLPLQCVADASVSTLPQIKASEAKEAAKNKPAETKQPASVAKKTTPSRPAESTPRATTGGKTMGAKGRAGQILAGGEGGRRQ